MGSLLSLVGAGCVACRRSGVVACASCLNVAERASAVQLSGLDRVTGVWAHRGLPRELVLGLKLRGMRTYGEPLVDGLVEVLLRVGTNAAVVGWPPCSRSDKRRRGFDHAEVLARGVASRVGLPAVPLLERTRGRADQAALSGEERRRNLVGAFTARATAQAILLVDDVVTTGATLQACAAALRAGGAPQVEAAAVCSAF